MKMTDEQFEMIKRQLNRVMAVEDGMYAKKFAGIDIDAIKTPEDFAKLPFTDKSDLRATYPLGPIAVPASEVVRIHSSSGTTGTPVVIPYTQKDVDDWATQFARCYEYAGVTKEDRVQITPGYGLWTAGIGFQAGCEKLGAMAVPMGPGNTEKQIQMMIDFETTVLCATSSYALLLGEEIEKRGLRDKIKLKKGIIGSERWSDKMRQRIEDLLGIELYDIYGLTEIYGPGIGISCQESDAMHVWSDFLYLELIDPKTGELVPDGEPGEIVLTTLQKEGAPLIRFRTHDLSRVVCGECPCGHTEHPRIGHIMGRSDDMMKIHGVNVFPKQIEEVLELFPQLSSEYQIRLSHLEGRDTMRIYVETDGTQDFLALAGQIAAEVKSHVGFTPLVKVVEIGLLPRSSKKSKRVIDERE